MSTQELIYDVIIFFFTDTVHFAELLILIFVTRGDVTKAGERIKKFAGRVRTKYREKLGERLGKVERLSNNK